MDDAALLPDDTYDSEGCGGGNAASHAAFIDPRNWIDYLPRAYAASMPPVGLTTSGLWNPRYDRSRTPWQNVAARDTADADDRLDSAVCTIATCGHAAEDKLTYLRRFKCKKALTGEERVAERLVYFRFLDTTAAERSSNGVDALLNALDDKQLELTFLEGELGRFVESGAMEFGTFRNLLDALAGLQRNPTKGFWEPCQFGRHVGIDSASGMFYAPADKLDRLSRHATRLIGRATRSAMWLPVRELQSLAGQAQYLFLAIPVAKFFRRELHSVVGDRWRGERVRMTAQLRRDLQWWTSRMFIGADRLSRHLDSDDWQLDPLLFSELESRLGPHSIDRFESALNTMLPSYNAAWLDPTCETEGSSGAAATVVAPRWEGKVWHYALTEMAVEELTVAPRADLFRPGWRDGRAIAASYMKQYFRFCEEERRPALAAGPGTMARYVTWLGNMGTIKASSLQPYLSAVNNFFKDHGRREPMALGDLVSRVGKGLAAPQVTLRPKLMRAQLPARVVLKALTLAKALRLQLGLT
eukprot:jgi/Tetstr1/444028/TSEL_031967.t2